ncbi:MAG: hypothetical protein H7323_01160 [Frankiales bacterium]|nr:hypothetical protein [Frankiales bacterium]
MLAWLALMAASIVLPWEAVIAANAGPARGRQRIHVQPASELAQAASSAPAAGAGTAAARGADTARKGYLRPNRLTVALATVGRAIPVQWLSRACAPV